MKRILPVILLVLTFATARAEFLAINNPGFEANVVANGTFSAPLTPTGWQTYDPAGILARNYNSVGVLNPTGTTLYPGGAPQGSNVALIFLWPQTLADNNQPAGLRQTLAATLQPFTQYTFSVRVGNIADDTNPNYSLVGFPGYRTELLAGSQLLAADNNSLSPADGTFALSSIVFTTGAAHAQLGQALTLRLINLNVPNSGIEVNFDDVRLEAISAIPEPSTIVMGCAALLLAGARALRNVPRRA